MRHLLIDYDSTIPNLALMKRTYQGIADAIAEQWSNIESRSYMYEYEVDE